MQKVQKQTTSPTLKWALVPLAGLLLVLSRPDLATDPTVMAVGFLLMALVLPLVLWAEQRRDRAAARARTVARLAGLSMVQRPVV